jgi:hypothetical protein
MKKNLWVTVLLLAVVLILPLACKAPAAPAQFEVTSFNISPLEITAGETASIAAQVKNVGGSEGVYSATLTVDGTEIERKDITVAAGATETVTFSLVKDKAGNYQVAVGGQSSSLTVKPKLVAKEMELKYDDGAAYQVLVSVDGGWLVDFLPPVTPFALQKIRLFGSSSSSASAGRIFEVEIWDKDRKILWKDVYSVTKFPVANSAPGGEALAIGASWVELEVPNIRVQDRFYIHMWNGPKSGGIHLGLDDSVKNEHSAITMRTTGVTKEIERWGESNFCLCWIVVGWPKSKTNCMIRVVGTVMVPEDR